MTPGASFNGLPRLADQHPDVFPGSPTALLAVFCAIIQARFYRQGGVPELPWFWSADGTPRTDDSGGLPSDPPGESPDGRRIEIAPATQEHPDQRGNYPALLIGRGPLAYQTIGVRRTVHEEHPFRAQMLMCHASTAITIQCLSRNDGESANLADVVASYLYGSTQEIRAEFGIYNIGDPVIGTTDIYRRLDNEVHAWRTDVRVDVTIAYKWYKHPLAPLLREFRSKMFANGEVRDLRAVLLTNPPAYP